MFYFSLHSSLFTLHFSLFTSHPLGFEATPCYNRLVKLRNERSRRKDMAICGQCGKPIKDDAKFCGGCGPRERCPPRPWKPPLTSQQPPRPPSFAPLVANRWPNRVPPLRVMRGQDRRDRGRRSSGSRSPSRAASAGRPWSTPPSPPPVPPPQATKPVAAASPKPTAAAPGAPPAPGTKKKGSPVLMILAIAALVGCVLLAAAGVGGYFLWKKAKAKASRQARRSDPAGGPAASRGASSGYGAPARGFCRRRLRSRIADHGQRRPPRPRRRWLQSTTEPKPISAKPPSRVHGAVPPQNQVGSRFFTGSREPFGSHAGCRPGPGEGGEPGQASPPAARKHTERRGHP